jgi:predicted outer membrane repeat protein
VGGSVTVNHSTFSSNKAAHHGGAIMVENANITLTTTSLTSNTAVGGAGLDVLKGNVTIKSNSLVEHNAATGAMDGGGGMAVSSGMVSVNDSIVSYNTAK